MLHIGIDTGVNTGFAVWDQQGRSFLEISTLKIHQAFERVKFLNDSRGVIVYVEDARQRKFFGRTGRERLQGAGSVKRDAVAWEDFLKDYGIDFRMVAPKDNVTRVDEQYFRTLTKWSGRTSVHERAAAMLVFGR